MSSFANNKKIVKNTIALYVRMVVMLVISFFTSRVTLQALGIVDIGINNVVGGIVSLLTLVNSSMSLSVQRFLSFEIGKGDSESLNQLFSSAVIIHFLLGLLILFFGETLGLYFLTHYVNYPVERETAVMWVYQMAIFSSFLGIIQVPYSAIIVAYEKMFIFAYFTVLDVLIRLLLVFLLLVIPYDKLIFFSIFGAGASFTMFAINRVYFHIAFRNVRFQYSIDKEKVKSLSIFAGWSTFGEFAWAGTNQGVNILLNIFFGPAINGARGIAYQVQHVVLRFIQSYQTAMQPQIVKLYAAGELNNMQNLVYKGTCFSYYLALFFSLPIILEPNFLLWLWLGTVPEHLALFTQLVLGNVLLDMLTNLLAAAAKAYGRIGRYQMTVSCILGMNFVFSYIALHLGMPAYAVFIVYAFISLALVVTRLYLLQQMIPEMTARKFLREAIVPIVQVSVAAIIIPLTSKILLPEIPCRAFIICSITAISILAAVWCIGLSVHDRAKLKQKVHSIFLRSCHE